MRVKGPTPRSRFRPQKRVPVPFPVQCRAFGLPEPVPEYRFHPDRRWRFDWAFPSEQIAVEQEGGIWIRGRHSRGAGFEKDTEKYAAAVILGWRVFRASPKQIADGIAVAWVVQAVGRE